MSALDAEVAACLAEIDEDSPRFRERCEALRSVPAAALLAAARFSELALELRKLRPQALWAYGAPEVALSAKMAMCLDGIICPVTAGATIPKAQGKECWLELEAEAAESLLPTLPMGWGVLVRGVFEQIPWENLRRNSRLRPLGVHLTVVPGSLSAPVPLDLVLGPSDVGYAEALSTIGSRALVWPALGGDEAVALVHVGRNSRAGLVCETSRALDWMLRLGTQGLCRTLPT